MPLVPLFDQTPRLYIRRQYVTLGLVVANVLIFLILRQAGTADDHYAAALGFGAIPARLFGDALVDPALAQASPALTLLTHQFLHADWAHLGFNMLFLWVFGGNVEDAMGHARFAAFYLVCGALSGLAQGALFAASVAPTIGASGAISGVLGAYALLRPRARILVLAFAMIPVWLPAVMVIGVWFAQDLLWATFDDPRGEGIALWAHLGGTLAGAALAVLFCRREIVLFGRRRAPWG